MQYIGFNLNNNEYSIPVLKVREIIHAPPITKMPQSPSYIEGITNFRGNIIPVVNLKKLVGINHDRDTGDKVIVVASGKVIFGVLVDGVTGVIDIEESSIEPPERFLNGHREQVSGVAKVSDRLVILLNTKTLIPHEDMNLFEDFIDVRQSNGEKVEVVKTVQTMAGEVKVKELHDIKDFLEKQGIATYDPRYILFDDMIAFMDALAVHDYERANIAIQDIAKKGQDDLFQEIGKITRKLHDALNGFKEVIDPKFKEIATVAMPHAIDSLQFVIDRTEEATNKTLGIKEFGF
jgi:chemotaxis protein CheZ